MPDCTCGEFAGSSVIYADCPVHGAPAAEQGGTLTGDLEAAEAAHQRYQDADPAAPYYDGPDVPVECDLWWGYLCPALSNIGALKEAQRQLAFLGVDQGAAGRVLSHVQSFYVDAAHAAARRYLDEQGTPPGSAAHP